MLFIGINSVQDLGETRQLNTDFKGAEQTSIAVNILGKEYSGLNSHLALQLCYFIFAFSRYFVYVARMYNHSILRLYPTYLIRYKTERYTRQSSSFTLWE